MVLKFNIKVVKLQNLTGNKRTKFVLIIDPVDG